MLPEEKKKLIGRIEKRIIRTRKEIIHLKEFTAPVSPGNDIGRISRMEAINNKSIAESSLREHEERLRNLEFQLSRYGTPDFGKCVNCSQEIQFGRLLAMPESTKCFKCAGK